MPAFAWGKQLIYPMNAVPMAIQLQCSSRAPTSTLSDPEAQSGEFQVALALAIKAFGRDGLQSSEKIIYI